MALSILAFITAITILAPVVRTSLTLSIDSTVNAGKDTDVNIDFNGQGNIDTYKIYLATTATNWGSLPTCLLVNYTNSDVTQVQVNIPADVAPQDTTSLKLFLSTFNSDGGLTPTAGYSNEFTLDGADGDWSQLELNGVAVATPDYCPCSALQCSRDCANQFEPDGTYPSDNQDDSFYQDWYNCLSACPDTTYPAWDDINGWDGWDGSTQTTTATGSRTATTSSHKSTSTRATATGSRSTNTANTKSTSNTGLTVTAALMWCIGKVLML